MDRPGARRLRIAAASLLLLLALGVGAFAVRAATEPRYGWGVIARYPGTRRLPSAAENAAVPGETFVGCHGAAPSVRSQQSYRAAERRGVAGRELRRIAMPLWLRTQELVVGRLEPRIKAAVPSDYADVGFDPDHFTVIVAMRNHSHDAAIRGCARRMQLFGAVRIVVHRWNVEEVDAANAKFAGRVGRAGLDRVVDSYLEGATEDGYRVTVFGGASGRDIERIRKYVEQVGVAARIERVHGDRPKMVLQ